MNHLRNLWYKAYALAPDAIRPCVCSSAVPKSQHSAIASPHKIPTVLNHRGEYVGIQRWQHRQDIVKNKLEEYAANPVYGILLLCKDFLVVDVDIEDAETIEQIHALLPETFYRYRNNSARRAYIYRKGFYLKKNIIPTPKGCIEFLGDSQVCQIAGAHKSGAQLLWHPAFPVKKEIPLMTKEQFMDLYDTLSKRVSGKISIPVLSTPNNRNKPTMINNNDLELKAVINSNNYIDMDPDGKVFVKCPFEHQHTSPTNRTDACYFPKGYQGNDKSGFHCFHATHGTISVVDFLEYIDYKEEFIPNTPDDHQALKKQAENINNDPTLSLKEKASRIFLLLEPLLELKRNKRRARDEIVKSFGNYRLLFECFPPALYYDRFSNRTYYNGKPAPNKYSIKIEGFYDDTFHFATSNNRVGITCAIENYLMDNQKDPLATYFEGLRWDGTRRLATFHTDCLGLPRDDVAARAYMYYLFTALAARGLGKKPVQADMIVTLCGAQGIGKTTFVRKINPNPDWYRSLNLITSKEEKIRTAQGFFAIELAEISRLNSYYENEIKDFVTQTKDTWRPLYCDATQTKTRRFVLIGTSNHEHFLNDTTGNRRWLPLHLRNPINTEYLDKTREQLFAEAVELYKQKGIQYEKAENYAARDEYKYLIRDRWTYQVEFYLKENHYPTTVEAEHLLENVIGVKPSSLDNSIHLSKMHRVLKSLRYRQSDEDPNQFEKIR